MSPNVATDRDVLARCVQAIELNDDSLDSYDTWCALLRAICAACNGDMEFFATVVLPWLRTNPTNVENDGDSRMEDKWKSFTDSSLGAECVYTWAERFGCTDGVEALNRARAEQAQEIFDGIEDVAEVAQAPGAVGAGGAGQAQAPAGPIPFNDTHIAVAEAFEAQFADKWRYDVDRRLWFTHDGSWKDDPRVATDLQPLMSALSQQILATVNGPQGAARSRALESTGSLMSVKRMVECDRR
jgi:hypothetical protein